MKLKPTLNQLRRQMARAEGKTPPPKPRPMTKSEYKKYRSKAIQSMLMERQTVGQLLGDFFGPWVDQPKAVEWRDPATGYKCLILKHDIFGTLMGYVRILRTHPLYNVGKDTSKLSRLDVHGGVTFDRKVSHKRYMKRGRWIGFDCAHAGDLNPGTTALMAKYGPNANPFPMPEEYRDAQYVKGEVEKLAAQLKKREGS